jgi:hypothetical protein
MRPPSFQHPAFAAGFVATTLLATTFHAGSAQACTFGTLSSCSISVGALKFDNFNYSGVQPENDDTITVSVLPGPKYTFQASFSPGGQGFVQGDGTLTFAVTAVSPGYTLSTVAAGSNTSNSTTPYYTVTNTLTGIASPLVSLGGASVSAVSFITPPSSTSVSIAWVQGGVNNALLNTSLDFVTNPPAIPVPGPLPLFGAATAFGFSRRLRRRVSAPQAS